MSSMRIEHATAFLYALKPRGIRFGLENTRLVLQRLGNIQKRFRVIHVAGSNGKGSTCAFLDAMLRHAGYRVGFYSSPHLIHFRERFCVNGESVGDEIIVENVLRLLSDGLEVDPGQVVQWVEREKIIQRMEQGSWYQERGTASQFTRLTFFECATLLCVLIFASAGVEIAVMETGMGGRLDATNVFEPVVSVITPIHLEHTAWLGDTIAAIAGEKAGIIKPNIPVVSALQHPDAKAVIEQEAEARQAPLSMMGRDFDGSGSWRDAHFRLGTRALKPVQLGLVGPHQVVNAATALACRPWLEKAGIRLPMQAIYKGLRTVRWPGRFERFGKSGEWILDGAHNPDGAKVLAESVQDVFGGGSVRMVFGVLKDKEVERMLPALMPLASEVHLVHPADARGRDPSTLLPFLGRPATLHSSVAEALSSLDAGSGHPILVTGSLTVVGEAREWLLEHGEVPFAKNIN
jgi:dihydrofolate synthase / folylpolyglutamate synthase